MKHANPHSTPVTLSFTKIVGLLPTQISCLKIESSEINPSDLEDWIYAFVNHAAGGMVGGPAEDQEEEELGMIDPQQDKFRGSQKNEQNFLYIS